MNFLSPTASPPPASATMPEDAEIAEDEEVFAAWQAVDFENLQLSLEEQAEQVVDMQETRLNQRKELAQRTKDFRTSKESSPSALDVIKLYQVSLDDVTNQAKFSSSAFLTAFKILRELPDPTSSLARALNRISALSVRIKLLEEREEGLTNALRASRERAKGAEELRAERDQFREHVQLDGDAKIEGERVAAQEKLAQAQATFEEEMAKLQTQLDLALEEIERLKMLEASSNVDIDLRDSRARADSTEVDAARAEGYAAAERTFAAKLEEATRLAEASSMQYQSQLDELRNTISFQMEHIGDLKAELSQRPDHAAHEKLKTQLAIMTRLTAADNTQSGTEDKVSTDKLDGLEAWLLHTNQRLVEELNQVKEELAKVKASAEQPAEPMPAAASLLLTPGPQSAISSAGEDSRTNLTAIKSQRDRLRAVLEKRDLEIERLQNQVDERDQRIRRLEDDAEKLRQRVRFLQSYKASDKSTLLPAANATADPESGPAMLGRGVSHEFRGLWEMDRKNQTVIGVIRNILINSRKDRRSMVAISYLLVVHLAMVWALLFRSC